MLSEFRSTNITWDKATSRIYSPVTANESDENGRKLVVQIVNGGQVEDLTGSALHLYWITIDKLHDGLDVFKAVDLKKGEFELSYTTGMLSNKGVLNANLVLIDTVGRVVSERFKITVTKGIDDDAIQSENSFSSLTQALIDVSHLEQTYAPRLNDLTAQLQQTATKTELQSVASGSPKGVYTTLSALQTAYPTGNANIYVVSADGNWYYWEGTAWTSGGTYQSAGIADKAVTPRKTNFIYLSSNLYNTKTDVLGELINSSGGTTISSDYARTSHIEVEPGETCYFYGFIGVSMYDNLKTFISRTAIVDSGQSVTLPANCHYVVLNYSVNTSYIPKQMNLGNVKLPYEDYKQSLNNTVDVSSIENNVVTPQKTTFVKVSNNLFNRNTLIDGGISLDGTVLPDNGYAHSDYISVNPSTSYSKYGFRFVAFYTSEKTFMSRLTFSDYEMGTFTTPSNASYIMTMWEYASSSYEHKRQINLGSTLTNYEPYGYHLDSTLQNNVLDSILQSNVIDQINLILSRFKNKEGNFLGDSITFGYTPNSGIQLNKPFPVLVGEKLGLTTVNNYGISSSCIADTGNSVHNPMSVRYINMSDEADFVFILGGTNDWAQQVPIGTISDDTIYTFYGALNILADGLLTKYPTATLVFATPMRRVETPIPIPLLDYRNAMLKIGEKYGIAVLDLYATSGFYPINTVNYNAICPDGRHPNEAGHMKLANRISGFLNTL